MIADIARFYLTCLRRAFSGVVGLLMAIFTAAGFALGLVRFLPVPAQWQDAVMGEWPYYVTMGLLLLVTLGRFMFYPYAMHREEQQQRKALEHRLQPRFRVELAQSSYQAPTRTVEGADGSRQQVFTAVPASVTTLLVRNIGKDKARNCRAKILAIRTKEFGSDISIAEPIILPWDFRRPEDHLAVDLDPGEARRIWISRSVRAGYAYLVRDFTRLPVEYQTIFGTPGIYELTVQILADGVTDVEVCLDLVVVAPEAAGRGPMQQLRMASAPAAI
ncbi:hypothetical protein [Paracoccus sp. pheM1]|uniref:hypothetical protein n=1 Tax=Paracoccus sp. pheM1 TaxID=2831675 RepID=UPI001BDB8BB6|nr:hypothetical protein [Paracoccus sp. pheM1]MBT0779547.1 hypothetical protein [Paracoccus sp. pheM1]